MHGRQPGKKQTSPQGQTGDFTNFDEDGGDGAASGGHHPKFDQCHLVRTEAIE
jgi:hypothetical protein